MSRTFKPVVVSGNIAEVKDTAIYMEKDASLDFGLKDLVPHNAFIRSLADKKTGSFNLENLFDQNLRPLIDAPVSKAETSLLTAENDSSRNVATTTVSVLSNDRSKATSVHVIINKEFGRSLIVGDGAPRGVKQAFAKAGIRYVDRNAKNALADIRQGIAEVVGSKTEDVTQAFKYRNEVRANDKAELAKLLAAKKQEMLIPKYIVKR